MSGRPLPNGAQSFTAFIVNVAPPLSTLTGPGGAAQGVQRRAEISGPIGSAGTAISRTPAARTSTASSTHIASRTLWAFRQLMVASIEGLILSGRASDDARWFGNILCDIGEIIHPAVGDTRTHIRRRFR